MDLQSLVTILGLIGTWTVLIEWRIRMLHAQFKEKLEDVDRVNKVVQNELAKDIARLETKIDMLLKMQIMGAKNNGNSKED